MKTKKLVITALFIALSFIGANIKIMDTIAFDAMPGFLGVLLFGPVYGAFIGAIGHFLTALTSGFPMTIPVHLIIMVGMAVTMLAFGHVYKYFSAKNYGAAVILSLIVGVIINGPLLLIVLSPLLIPMLGRPALIGMAPVLSLVAGINIIIAQGIYKVLPEKYKLWK
jgi:uncharacterized membrane protein